MDDTFIVTKNNNEAQNLLETFNRIHQAVTSTREENCSVFFSSQYTDIWSLVPLQYKRSLVK